MSRRLVAAAAQLGPIHRADSRESVVRRLVDLMRQAADRGCGLVVYPELALTTFFPRWLYDSQDEVDAWFEREMPNAAARRATSMPMAPMPTIAMRRPFRPVAPM